LVQRVAREIPVDPDRRLKTLAWTLAYVAMSGPIGDPDPFGDGCYPGAGYAFQRVAKEAEACFRALCEGRVDLRHGDIFDGLDESTLAELLRAAPDA
jgi:hypothetical protein